MISHSLLCTIISMGSIPTSEQPLQHRNKVSVIVFVLLVSLLTAFFPLQQTFAQTDQSVKILITDAIEDLQNNDTNTALIHSNLASQELSSQGVSSSDSALVLINDAIQDLLNNDTDTALTHLSLVSKQLEILSNGATTSAVSLNKTSAVNTTLIESQRVNAIVTLGKDECTDNNLDGICGLDKPKSSAHVCSDANHDFNCDWFRRPVGNGSVWANATDLATAPSLRFSSFKQV